jgi:hypothetical protein
VVSALLLGFLEQIMAKAKGKDYAGKPATEVKE